MIAPSAAAKRPRGRPRVSFRWINLLFMHWPVPADQLQHLIPDQFDVETHDGNAWIGLVPFTMTHVRRRPFPPLPGMSTIHETNVRTYVSHKGQGGVYFFSLDASHAAACAWARRFWHLNYVYSHINVEHDDQQLRYNLRRAGDPATTYHCRWRCGARREHSQPGTLDHFLTERYTMFTTDRMGRVLRGRIWHEPWPLHEAELISYDGALLRANGVTINGTDQPVLHHCDRLDAEAWPLEIA